MTAPINAPADHTCPLPTIADRPQADIVIFDGKCNFCRNGVERLHGLDTSQRLAFISLHDPEVARRWPQLSHEDLMREMYVVERGGDSREGKRGTDRLHGGPQSLRFLSRRLPLLWIVAPLLHIPLSLPFWNWLYQAVARRRYKISGQSCESGACDLHRGDK